METAIDQRGKASEKEPVPKGAWLVLFGVWLVTCAAPMNMFKPTTISPEIMAALSIPPTSYGWIMSVFSIMGLILAMPASGIVYRLGIKKTFLVSIGSMTLGTLLGALANDYILLLVSRIIEGTGMGFMAVATPTAISLWFPPSRRALPLGIYQTWLPVGSLLTMNLAPILTASFGWHAIWWFCLGFCICACVVFLATWKEPPAGAFAEEAAPAGESGKLPLSQVLRNPSVWVLCLVFLVFAFTCAGTTPSFWPLYMRTEVGLDPSTAAFIASLCTILGLAGAPLGGWLADRIGRLKVVMMIGWAAVVFYFCFAFSATSIPFLFVLAVVNGLLQGWIPVATTASVLKVVGDKSLVPFSMGLLNVFRNGGNILGGMALAYVIDPFGWAMGSWMLCLPPIFVAIVLVMVVTRKVFK